MASVEGSGQTPLRRQYMQLWGRQDLPRRWVKAQWTGSGMKRRIFGIPEGVRRYCLSRPLAYISGVGAGGTRVMQGRDAQFIPLDSPLLARSKFG